MDNYIQMIDYLIQDDISFYREDIRQELLFFLWQLSLKIDEKKILPEHIDSYIFISLKRKNQKLNQKYKKIRIQAVEYVNKELTKQERFYLVYIYRIAKERLAKSEYILFDLYFIQGLSLNQIAKKRGVSRQYIHKSIQKIILKIKKIIF